MLRRTESLPLPENILNRARGVVGTVMQQWRAGELPAKAIAGPDDNEHKRAERKKRERDERALQWYEDAGPYYFGLLPVWKEAA